MPTTKTLVLCADDYGLNPGVSQGIRALLAKKRLSATSCMVTFQDWPEQAELLAAHGQHAKLGLHFNLTEGYFLSKPELPMTGLTPLIARAYLRQLDPGLIEAELSAQLDRFTQHLGRMPDFIDGHQHIQQLPLIRECFLKVYHQRFSAFKPWVRATWPGVKTRHFSLKAGLLALLGGRSFQKLLQEAGIPHWPCFAGIHDFSNQHDYGDLFRSWLAAAPDQTLMMCHPGLEDPAPDPIAASRQREWAYLSSDRFIQDLSDYRFGL